ncbi:MAG: FHA domain-containing protein [Pseudomonadota bacterium]
MGDVLQTLSRLEAVGPPSLEVLAGSEQGKSFELPSPGRETMVGRGEDAGIVIVDPEMSRRHALVRCDWIGAIIEDLGSKNGTVVAGERLVPGKTRRLFPGDTLTLGNTVLRFHNAAQERLAMLTIGHRKSEASASRERRTILAGRDDKSGFGDSSSSSSGSSGTCSQHLPADECRPAAANQNDEKQVRTAADSPPPGDPGILVRSAPVVANGTAVRSPAVRFLVAALAALLVIGAATALVLILTC